MAQHTKFLYKEDFYMNELISMYNGSFLKYVREKQNIDRKEVADVIGYKENDIKKFEESKNSHSNKPLEISNEKMDALAKLLHIPRQNLMNNLCKTTFLVDEKVAIDGIALKALREERGLTQEQLGNLVGYTAANISKIELSKTGSTLIEKEKANAIAKELNVDPVYLYCIDSFLNRSEANKYHKELLLFVNRLFCEDSLLRENDLISLGNIMSFLQFDEAFTNKTIEKIRQDHRTAQNEIRKFIDQISNNESTLLESDIHILRSMLKELYFQEKAQEYPSINDDIRKEITVDSFHKTEQKIEEIKQAHDNKIHSDLIMGPRVAPFKKF